MKLVNCGITACGMCFLREARAAPLHVWKDEIPSHCLSLVDSDNLESFDLGSDPETGEVTTAPIVRPTEATSRTTTAEPRLRRLTKNQQTMYSFLHDAGRNGLTTDEWNAIARANDIGTKRKADLVDLRSALKAKGLVREFNDRWTAVTD